MPEREQAKGLSLAPPTISFPCYESLGQKGLERSLIAPREIVLRDKTPGGENGYLVKSFSISVL
jgi:hypothetical protein